MFYLPSNPKMRYWTTSLTDPNIPVGYVNSQGSDGATPEALKVYDAGVNSGGFPAYTDDPTQQANVQGWINGILGGYAGGKPTG